MHSRIILGLETQITMPTHDLLPSLLAMRGRQTWGGTPDTETERVRSSERCEVPLLPLFSSKLTDLKVGPRTSRYSEWWAEFFIGLPHVEEYNADELNLLTETIRPPAHTGTHTHRPCWCCSGE